MRTACTAFLTPGFRFPPFHCLNLSHRCVEFPCVEMQALRVAGDGTAAGIDDHRVGPTGTFCRDHWNCSKRGDLFARESNWLCNLALSWSTAILYNTPTYISYKAIFGTLLKHENEVMLAYFQLEDIRIFIDDDFQDRLQNVVPNYSIKGKIRESLNDWTPYLRCRMR